MHAHDRSDSSTDPGQIGAYTTPPAVRILVALSRGAQTASNLAIIAGCRGERTEEILLGLRRRGIVVHDRDGYRLTRSGELLADRLLTCASRLFQTLYGRSESSLPPMPLVAEGVLDDIGHLTLPAYLEAFERPGRADTEILAWMRSRGYLSETGGVISLNRKGLAYRTFLKRCSRTIATIDRFNEFFESHSLKGVPEPAIKEIGDLFDAGLIVDQPMNTVQGFAYYLEIIGEAQRLHGVSTYSLPQIAAAIWERVVVGAEVELVITPELAGALWEEEVVKKRRDATAFPNFRLYVSTVPVTVGLTVTDSVLSFGLCHPDGTYDTVYDLVGRTEEAVAWGERLFRHYKEQAVPIEDFFRNRENTTGSASIQQ
jgi:predicted transcriptional regulator